MATEIEIDTIINTDRSDDGIRQLRTGLKDLISLQTQVGKNSDQFTQLQKAIGDTETKIRTLNDGFGTLRGSGVDRLTNSIGLLKEGFSAADPEKLSIGMEGLGAAMKAIPIFLLIEGAKLLFDNFGKLVDMFSSSAIQARANAEELRQLTNQVDQNRISIERNIISRESELTQLKLYGAGYATIISKIKEINALKQDEFRAELQKSDKSIQNQIDVVKNLKDEIDNQTETSSLLEFLGIGSDPKEDLKKAEDELNKLMIARGTTDNAKIKAAVDTTNEIDAINKEAYDKLKQKYADDATEFNRLLGLKQEYSEALNAARIQDEENANAKLIKDYQDEKYAEQYLNDAFAQQDAEANADNDAKDQLRQKNAQAFETVLLGQTLQQKIDNLAIERDTQLQNENLTQQQRVAIIQKSENDILALKIQKGQQATNYASEGVMAVQAISDIAYNTQSANLTKGSKEADEAARKNFNINKGLQIANAAIQGAQAVLAAFSSGAAIPIAGVIAGPAFAAVAAGVAIANIAKIANTQYTSTQMTSVSNDAGTTPATLGGTASTSPINQPSFNPQAIGSNFKTNANQTDIQKLKDNKVYVLESDIRSAMDKVDVFESRATFGG